MTKLLLGFLFAFAFFTNGFSTEYDKVISTMEGIETANQNLVDLIDIGKNDQGTLIRGLKIELSTEDSWLEAKPAHLVVGVHHGNEGVSSEVALNFANKIIKILKTKEDPMYKFYSGITMYVIPVLNISGFNAGSRYETSVQSKSYDPNRDYIDPCFTGPSFKLASTSNLAKFLADKNIVGTVTIHGYIGTFTYPWGIYTSNTKSLDNNFFDKIAKESVKANGYKVGTHTDIIYPTAGAYEDFAYFKFGIWTMLLELKRGASVDNDALSLVTYFSQLPASRSKQHQHLGKCTNVKQDAIKARP